MESFWPLFHPVEQCACLFGAPEIRGGRTNFAGSARRSLVMIERIMKGPPFAVIQWHQSKFDAIANINATTICPMPVLPLNINLAPVQFSVFNLFSHLKRISTIRFNETVRIPTTQQKNKTAENPWKIEFVLHHYEAKLFIENLMFFSRSLFTNRPSRFARQL